MQALLQVLGHTVNRAEPPSGSYVVAGKQVPGSDGDYGDRGRQGETDGWSGAEPRPQRWVRRPPFPPGSLGETLYSHHQSHGRFWSLLSAASAGWAPGTWRIPLRAESSPSMHLHRGRGAHARAVEGGGRLEGPCGSPSPVSAESSVRGGRCIREFRAAEQEAARRIFYDGIMERIPNTAFRGLRQHPRTQLLYALLAALCFAVTRSLLLTCLVPVGLLGLRYYYSRRVILAYLECALHTDMADIEQYYMKPPGSCFWVAVLDGNVVGIVAARGHEEDNTVELLRMSVDSRFRGKGIAKALGRKVLEFALVHNYSAVVLGTTAVKVAAHKLYESLGFRHMGASDHYVLPGMTHSLAERLFFQVRYHRYRLQLREE
ncbi:N-acetylaspartate synthetase [Trichechus manatus latirostris]|uniref:N-acetylaspartate synthetase n=1 Tax=Trichechus manatus latirostris TaxID=127582 RepID=A0A2Y9DZY4_TRIMA|nr:N-acetylaspartate synthetase [Trichechus manatus latirostris]